MHITIIILAASSRLLLWESDPKRFGWLSLSGYFRCWYSVFTYDASVIARGDKAMTIRLDSVWNRYDALKGEKEKW